AQASATGTSGRVYEGIIVQPPRTSAPRSAAARGPIRSAMVQTSLDRRRQPGLVGGLPPAEEADDEHEEEGDEEDREEGAREHPAHDADADRVLRARAGAARDRQR